MKTNDNRDATMTRAFVPELSERKIDEAARTVTMPVASETPVQRWFGSEILSMADGAVDLSRLNNAAAVLEEHGNQIGVIERAWIEGARLWVTARFGKGQRASEVWQDIVDGIRRNVSIGYQIMEREVTQRTDGGDSETWTVTRWMPYETSVVSVPADPTVGVGRSLESTGDAARGDGCESVTAQEPEQKATTITVQETRAMDPKDQEKVQADTLNAERARVREIQSMGRQFNCAAEAEKAVEDGMPLDQFRGVVLAKQAEAAKAVAERGKDIGLNEKERKDYSFLRAIGAMLCPGDSAAMKAAAFELECSRAYAAKIGVAPKGIFVPPDVCVRTFNLTTGGGSNVVATNLRPDMFIDILRNQLIAGRAGVTMMAGLVGNVAIPRQTAASTAYWFASESAGVTSPSNPTIDQVTLSPKTVGASVDISRQLLKQSTPDAEALVRNDLAQVLALAIDLAVVRGTASSGQPRGIVTTSGIDSSYWATDNAPTWAEIVGMETAVETANALAGTLAYVMGAGLVGYLKANPKHATAAIGLMMESDGTVNGYPCLRTNQMAAGQAIFGNFADVILGMWGGLDLTVNPYLATLEAAGAVRLTALQDVDVAVRRPAAFAYRSNDPAT